MLVLEKWRYFAEVPAYRIRDAYGNLLGKAVFIIPSLGWDVRLWNGKRIRVFDIESSRAQEFILAQMA